MSLLANISFDSIIWLFAGGKPFFAGVALLLLTTVITFLSEHKTIRLICHLLQIPAILAIILSTTPLHPALYIIWFVLLILCYAPFIPKRFRPAILSLFILFCTGIMFVEFPWHLQKTIRIETGSPIVIIGDSISAGMGNDDEATWPKQLSEITGVETINLARAGATVQTALKRQVPQVPSETSLVIIEIGGNDLLNNNSLEDFEKTSDEILSQLQSAGHQVMWLELPLLPHYYFYGRVQRKLARKYHITLIPKSIFADVFSTDNATSDGMHLTTIGHITMAQKITTLLKIE